MFIGTQIVGCHLRSAAHAGSSMNCRIATKQFFFAERAQRELRRLLFTVALLVPIAAGSQTGSPPPNPDLETYFRQYIGLSLDQIASIRSGQPVTKALPSRTPAEVFLFGAVYIHAAPESYIE